jgi:large repetitive protein
MSRREKRQRFSQWLSEFLFAAPPRIDGLSTRSILVEPLETRQVMAGDGFMALLGSSYHETQGSSPVGFDTQGTATAQGLFGVALVGEGEPVAEGEPADDLVAFAKALTDSGTRFFGAAWCQFCTEQKELFQDGGNFLPFIEVTNPDRTPNQIAISEGITEYPTWEFPDGSRLTGVQTLQTLAQRANLTIPQSSTPSMVALSDVNVGIGSPLHIPIDAYDPNGNPLTISVTSSNPGLITAQTLSGNRSLRLSMQGFGDMVFELFEDKAPRPTGRVIELAQDGFYDGVPFHRVINNFVIQAGDRQNQNGTGGSTLGNFDDQFHLDLQHNRTGVLSYAKSSDDTNDSQFFITEGPQRFLDFNHSVFGQLVEGEAVREAISNTATNSADRPLNPVLISSATVFEDTENGLIMLKPTGTGTGTATITVTVTDTEGNSTSRSFQATVVQDTANGAPFLNPIPTIQAQAGVPTQFTLTAQDAENDTLIYSVTKLGTENYTVTVDSATGVVTVTPPAGFSGQLQFRATVRQSTAPTTTSPDDNQVVTVVVAQSSPTGIDLLPGSDSGVSDSDNITNAQSLTFAVSGTTVGAVVEVLSGGNVVGTATATGTTTNVVVNNVASLGQGSVSFTSRQRVSGVNSAPSQSLAVVLDSQAPAAIAAGVIPASAVVDTPLSLDLNHPEEGQGLVYALAGAPSGMTINAATGQLAWTPTSAQLGTQSLTLRLTDAAGNVLDQAITINVIQQARVRISLNAVDLNGLPISTIATGQQFKVQVVVNDLRSGTANPNAPTGVYAAYLDLLFDSNIIEPVATNPINHLDPYLNDTRGATTTPGLIDELGAFSDQTSRLGSSPRVLAEVTFLAKAAGNPQLRSESADQLGNDILLYDVPSATPISQVEFGTSAFVVGADFTVANDVFNFDEDEGVQSLNVLSNDTITGAAVLTITSVSSPTGGGTVTIAADGKTLNYTSAANFNGAETFTYTVQNQQGIPQTATVTIQVADVNDPPVALNDTFTVFRNSTQNVLAVLANDTTGVDSPNSESLSISSVSSGSAGGTIERGPSGLTIRYTPAANFTGTETFTYTLSDGRGGTDTATVTVAVNLQNPPPTPQNDSFTVVEDAPEASFDVLANDTTNDPTETLSVSAVGTSQVGSTVSVAPDGLSVRYRPAANFAGTEVITYTLRDSGGATAVGQMTFTVTPVNDPPNAVDDTFEAFSAQTTTTLNVLLNDINVDQGETLTITAVSQPPTGSGTLAISGNGQNLIYTSPSLTFEGQFSFTYTIGDGSGLTDTATVTLNVRNFVPRKISGLVNAGIETLNESFYIAGFPLMLTGLDVTGASVNMESNVGTGGAYAFNNVAPGDYTLIREPLPFLSDSGSSVTINSGVTDGDLVSNLIVTGSLRVGLFDIRDFLGSTVKNSLTVALNADGTTNWLAPRGDWAQLSSLQAQMDTSGNALRINAARGTQTNLQATLPLNNNSIASVVGAESSMSLLRVRGSTTQAGLAASTGTASTASANSSTNTAGLLSGEGEGADSASAEAVPSSSSMPAIAQAPSRLASSSLRSTDRGMDSPGQPPLSPAQAIRQVLGSAPRASFDASTALAAEAVDVAMQSVLPSLELKLSDELQDTIANSGQLSSEATDAIVAQL